MGGGPVRECNRLVWGVDLVEEALFCSVGIPARPVVPPLPMICISYTFVNAPRSGKLMSTRCVEDLSRKDGVLSCDLMVAEGAMVTGASDGWPPWVALLVVARNTSKA